MIRLLVIKSILSMAWHLDTLEKTRFQLKVGQPVRIYLENMLEYDPMNNFHLHGEMFHYIPTGSSDKPTMYTDIVSLMQGDRGILEFAYHFPGEFMFHAHKNEFSRLGWQGYSM